MNGLLNSALVSQRAFLRAAFTTPFHLPHPLIHSLLSLISVKLSQDLVHPQRCWNITMRFFVMFILKFKAVARLRLFQNRSSTVCGFHALGLRHRQRDLFHLCQNTLSSLSRGPLTVQVRVDVPLVIEEIQMDKRRAVRGDFHCLAF